MNIHGGKLCFLVSPISSMKVGHRRVSAEDWSYLMERVITPVLNSCGFEVVRADSINKSGSIIRDIVGHLVTADLVIADLTGLNPNVLYELGVRHSISNRTILLTQKLSTLPFDLKGLRTIEYSLQADGPDKLRDRLKSVVLGISRATAGDLDNPVLEYFAHHHAGGIPDHLAAAVTYQQYLAPTDEARRSEEQKSLELTATLASEFALIEPGTVVLGLPDDEITEVANLFNVAAKARHQVRRREAKLKQPFLISKYPITNAQYRQFVRDTLWPAPAEWRDGFCEPVSLRDHPVTGVTHSDAVAYCEWLSDRQRVGYRLPTEMEWEAAARGDMPLNYPWGDTISPESCNSVIASIGHSMPVTTYAAFSSRAGVADLSGNTWEWCEPTVHEGEPPSGEFAVLKGGSWESSILEVKVGYREIFRKQHSHCTISFRVVREK